MAKISATFELRFLWDFLKENYRLEEMSGSEKNYCKNNMIAGKQMCINSMVLIYGLTYRQQSCYKGKVYLLQYKERTAILFHGSRFRLYGFIAYRWEGFNKDKGFCSNL